MTALELMALALVNRAMQRDARPEHEPSPVDDSRHDPIEVSSGPAPAQETVDALGFITEAGDSDARYYRASDALGEVLAGFFGDGRVRLADGMHRFAGVVQNGHADVLDLTHNTWSEVFVRVTPDGGVQLEVRGGPYDARVLTCRPLEAQDAV